MPDAPHSSRWLLLTSSTGTGHNMRAASISTWAQSTFGADRIQLETTHVLEQTHRVYAFGVGLYNFIQRHAPILHHLYFNYLEIAGHHRHPQRILGADRYKAQIQALRPDRIISVHAHTNHGYFALAREAARDGGFAPPACATYCGELMGGYGFSRHWVNAAADGFIGATEEVCAAAHAAGLPTDRSFNGGFLLRAPFYADAATREAAAAAFAQHHHLRRDLFTVVFSTGLAGANNHAKILRALAAADPEPLQAVFLCGHRDDTRAHIEQLSRQHPRLTIRALPSLDPAEMVSVQTLADVLVARPGTGTTSEAITLGVPLIHNGIGGIMPQELITVQYCKNHHASLVARSPREIAAIIGRLHQNPAEVAALRQHLTSARPQGTPPDIMRWIDQLAPRP